MSPPLPHPIEIQFYHSIALHLHCFLSFSFFFKYDKRGWVGGEKYEILNKLFVRECFFSSPACKNLWVEKYHIQVARVSMNNHTLSINFSIHFPCYRKKSFYVLPFLFYTFYPFLITNLYRLWNSKQIYVFKKHVHYKMIKKTKQNPFLYFMLVLFQCRGGWWIFLQLKSFNRIVVSWKINKVLNEILY